jgi:hypothetical protein
MRSHRVPEEKTAGAINIRLLRSQFSAAARVDSSASSKPGGQLDQSFLKFVRQNAVAAALCLTPNGERIGESPAFQQDIPMPGMRLVWRLVQKISTPLTRK